MTGPLRFAEPEDVAARVGGVTFDDAQTTQCEALLDDVSVTMRARVPRLLSWIESGDIEAGLAKKMACEIAMLAITVSTVGRGVTEEQHPEHRVTISDAAAAGIDLTDDQVDLLTPEYAKARSRRGKAFSILPG